MMLSIIIPVYNAEHYIERCIDSVENSDFKDFEIIAINDGSTDHSFQVLTKKKEQYHNIRILNQENNGVAYTRNRGIKEATGKYITFIDNDDFVDEDYLGRLVSVAERNKCDIVIEGYERRNSKNKLIERVRLKKCPWAKYQLTAPWGRIFKSSFLKEHDIKFLNSHVGEDAFFNITAISKTDNIIISEGCGYKWFYNEESVSSTVQRHPMKDIYILLSKMKDIFESSKNGLTEEKEYFLIKFACWYLFYINKKSINKIEEVRNETDKIFSWLEVNIVNYKTNKNISLFKPYGERFKNRAAIFLLIKSKDLGLEKILLKLMMR